MFSPFRRSSAGPLVPASILVIVPGHLGDLVSALPALRDIRAGFPNSKVTVVVNEYLAGSLENCPYVDDVVYGFQYSKRRLVRRFAQLTKLFLRVVGRFDVAIALRDCPRTVSALAFISGAKTRAGFSSQDVFGRSLTHNAGPRPDWSTACNRDVNLIPLRLLGVPASAEYPRLDWAPAETVDASSRLLASVGIEPGQRFAVVQLSCHWGCNEWRADKWATVIDDLAKRHRLRVVATGRDEPFEIERLDAVRAMSSTHIASLLGRTSIPQLFEVVKRASIVVASDSALTQIALAQRTPSVVLFGIEPMIANGPLPSEINELMECVQHWEGPERAPRPNAYCRFGQSSCHTANCRENSSLAQSTPDEVLSRVERILSRAAAAEGSAVP